MRNAFNSWLSNRWSSTKSSASSGQRKGLSVPQQALVRERDNIFWEMLPILGCPTGEAEPVPQQALVREGDWHLSLQGRARRQRGERQVSVREKHISLGQPLKREWNCSTAWFGASTELYPPPYTLNVWHSVNHPPQNKERNRKHSCSLVYVWP